MANIPAFQFYPGDWVQDTRCLSLAAKGAWIDLLCAMWRSSSRGTLSMPLVGYSRLIGATVDQAEAVIEELTDMHICEINTCNGNVTLINRRMKREEDERENTRFRVQKHRGTGDVTESVTESVTPLKRECNGVVTEMYAPSSSSSSLSKEELKSSPKENEEKESGSLGKLQSDKGTEAQSSGINTGSRRLPPMSAYAPTENGESAKRRTGEQAESSTSSNLGGGREVASRQSLATGRDPEELRPKPRPTFRGTESNSSKVGKLEMVWIAAGKSKADYDRLTKPPLPELTEDDVECLNAAGVEVDKKTSWYYRRGKALIGEGRFSELCHTCKNLRQEGKAAKVNDTARFMSYLAKEVGRSA